MNEDWFIPGLTYQPTRLKGETAYRIKEDPGEIGYQGAPGRGSITNREAEILAEMATGLDVLEIGTGTGFSTLAMNSTAKSVTTVDVDPWVIENVFPYLESRGVICLQSAPEEGEFGFIFVDGNHEQSSVTEDMKVSRRLAAPGASIAIHDLHISGVSRSVGAVRELGTALSMGVLDP